MKSLKTEVAYRTPFFEILAKTIETDETPYYALQLPDYVGVLALTAERQVLVVRQYRPAVERYTLELPAGMVPPGEKPVEAAERELMEETAHETGSIELLGPVLPDAGRLANVRWNYIARDCRPMKNAQMEAGIEVLTYSVNELIAAIAAGTFNHSLDVAAVMLAVSQGKLDLTGEMLQSN